MNNNNKAQILALLEEKYSGEKSGLNFTNPFELLIATILSAQANDNQVNKVTKTLFEAYRTPEDFLALGVEGLQEKIKTIGLYVTKSKHIIKTCQMLIENYGGEVPSSFENLIALPGVGRKTANVVLSNAFGVPALAVDTHVFRVSNRLGLAKASTVEKTEEQLQNIIPVEKWAEAHHWLIWHGRRVCKARNPECKACFLQKLCPYNIQTNIIGAIQSKDD